MKFIILCGALCASLFAAGQSSDQYLNNIVNLQGNQYGLIVGESGGKLYGITASPAADGDILGASQAYLYKQTGALPVSSIRSFRFGESRVFLFEIQASGTVAWTAHSYAPFGKTAGGSYFTYIPDKRRPSRWYDNATPFSQNSMMPSEDEAVLTTANGNTYTQGMPVVDPVGNLVGIIADKQDELGKSTVVRMVTFEAIAKRMYDASQCKYFQFVEAGYNFNRCERARQTAQLQARETQQAKRDGKLSKVAWGPALFGGLGILAAKGRDSGRSAFNWALGANVYVRPDEGKVTLTLMPRVYFSKFQVKDAAANATQGVGFRVEQYSWQCYEMPVLLDILFRRSVGINTYFSLGYAPGYQNNVAYKFSTSWNPSEKRVLENTGGYSQKVIVGLGCEGRSGVRLDAQMGYHFSAWEKPAPYYLMGELVDPLQNSDGNFFFIGLHIGTRLNGVWGLKTVD